jgi:CBS domain-containing protein
MLICDVMTKQVISVTPETSVEFVAQLLIQNRIHGIPVVENGKPIGMVTENDFFTKGVMNIYLPEYIDFLKRYTLLEKISSDEKEKIEALIKTTAGDIMSSPCITISRDADVADFFSLIKETKMISVPVVDKENNLAGIITFFDILNLINIQSA